MRGVAEGGMKGRERKVRYSLLCWFIFVTCWFIIHHSLFLICFCYLCLLILVISHSIFVTRHSSFRMSRFLLVTCWFETVFAMYRSRVEEGRDL